jgi:murein DD-endopeptidase MepM/ murein hydrolase activator NlpD
MRLLTSLAVVPLVALATAPLVPPPGPGPGPAAYAPPVGPPLVVLRPFRPPPSDAPWLAGHRGVDLAAGVGSPVRAAAAGTVTFAGPLAGRGVVTVTAGALRWTYEPVRPSVLAGHEVASGATIGRLEAATGHCGTRPCLHWGLLRAHEYLDPLAPLGPLADRVRLLPLSSGAAVEPLDEPFRPGLAAAALDGEPSAAAVAGGSGAGPPGASSTGLAAGLAAAGAGALVAAGAGLGFSRSVRRRRGLGPRGP